MSVVFRRSQSLDTIFSTKIPLEKQRCLPKKTFRKCKYRPDYPKPGELKVSTMTTTCYLSTVVHMKPVFYLIETFDDKLLIKNETEVSELQRLQQLQQPQRSQDNVYQTKNKQSKLFHALSAYLVSNQVKYHKNFKCPFSVFKQYFEKYYKSETGEETDFTDLDYIDLINGNDLPDLQKKLRLESMTEMYPRVSGISHLKSISKKYTELFLVGLDVSPLFPTILNIKYKDVYRGNATLASKKKKNKKAFYNQCTMRIALDDLDKVINLKIFKNGQLHMTGCRHTDDAQRAIDYLIFQLEILSHQMNLKNQAMAELRMNSIPSFNPAYDFPLELWNMILLRSNAWDIMKWQEIFPTVLLKDSFWLQKSERDYKYVFKEISDCNWKVVQRYDDRTRSYKRIFKSSVFENPCDFYFLHFDQLQRMPFVPLNSDSELKLVRVNIEMINSDFETHFNIDQNELTDILRAEPFNMFVKFDPLNYPGVNIKYECPIPEDNPKDISILVFRTGQVIITGGRCHEHLQQSYHFINNVFQTYYDKLWVQSE